MPIDRRMTLGAFLITSLAISGAALFAQQAGPSDEPHAQHHPDEQQPAEMPMDREAMMERCQQMMQHMQQMQGRMQQMDRELEQQLQALDEAEGAARIDAMEQVVRTLATQRLQMHQRHMQMMQNMMGHMGEHMMMDADDDQRQQMMMQCPVMNKDMMQPDQH